MKLDNEFLNKLKDLMDQYTKEVSETELKDSAKRTYLLHSNNFVRWCNGEFIPGATLKKKKRS